MSGATQRLSSREIIGMYFLALQQAIGLNWIGLLSMEFNSDQESETYKWFGQTVTMREWIGGRQAKGFATFGITIENLRFEATLKIPLRDLEREKTGQLQIRINELVTRSQSHWAKLLSAEINNGESLPCYDGSFFFATDHTEGDNETDQSNKLSIDISTLPVAVHGSTTRPSPQEMQLVIMQCIQAIIGFKDNENEPMNELAQKFIVKVPVALFDIAIAAVGNSTFGGGETNTTLEMRKQGFEIDVVANARLEWIDKVAVFRSDGNVKPFVRQTEKEVNLKVQAEGSQVEFDEDEWRMGIDARRNTGRGYWQHACIAQMT